MACCAFAVFLLAQLLAPFRHLAARLGLRANWQPDAAVAWNPGVAAAPARRLSWRQLMLAILAVDIALLAFFHLTGAAADMPRIFTPQTNAAAFEEALHRSICGPASRRG